jgi:hypothetical protein
LPDLYQPYLSGPLPEGPWTYVCAVMLSPRDDLAAHISTAIAMLSKMIDFKATPVDTPVETALRAAESLRDGPRLDERVVLRAELRGAVARVVLTNVLRAAEHGHSEFASVNVVLRWMSRELQRLGIARGAGIENLEKYWREYRCVAHLWAAVDELTGRELSQTALFQFLARAEELRRRGEAYTPPHGRETLLDAKVTWKVPDGVLLPAAAASLPPLSDEELRLLKNLN